MKIRTAYFKVAEAIVLAGPDGHEFELCGGH